MRAGIRWRMVATAMPCARIGGKIRVRQMGGRGDGGTV